ncbi:hypothetical protein [Pelagicoccus sp. SDUM812002]|uniref:hypothetical protein n=1 Tax=Pelagicoccus sp. SDUM812002 TaxID=3041266 RepID=UPI00280D29A6|nr:hypothetical protein [Pelagicoccus sp. SDUM812002]MDQ8187740.1 hypothetical protein [Pelagicoccus sp. SDUM812002]
MTPFPQSKLPSAVRMVAGFVLAALLSVQTLTAQVPTGPWTGLDKSIHRGQLHELKLELKEASDEEAGLFPRRSPLALPALEKRILAGSMEFWVDTNRGKTLLRETRDIMVAYFPEIRIMSLHFKYGTRIDPINTHVGIYDPQDQVIAFFHTGGAARDSLPYILQAGRTPPQDLQQLTEQKGSSVFPVAANPTNVFQAAQQRKQAQQAAKRQQELILKYQPRIQALQQEMIAAFQVGNNALAQEKQREMQELAVKLKAVQRGEIPAEELEAGNSSGGSSTASKPGSGCPEEAQAWIGELEANGESHREFSGMVRLGNFFRDEYFVPHFEETFSDFSKQQSMKVSRDIQQRCLPAGSHLRNSAYVPTLGGIFMDSQQFNRFDALSTAKALDMLAKWQEQTIRRVEESGSLELTEAFELIRNGITGALWPSGQEVAREQMAEVVSSKVSKLVYSELEAILDRLVNADTAAPLRELMNLRRGSLASKIPGGKADAFEEALWIKVDPVLGRYLDKRLRDFGESRDGRETLAAGKRWHREAGEALQFIGERPAYRDFETAFSKQRQQSYDAAEKSLEADLMEITEKRAAMEFDWPFALKTDLAVSAAWRGLKALQQKRIEQIDCQNYLARVGDGPFAPDYPGSVYLNAVYRGDVQTMRAEDQAYQQQIREYLAPLLNSSAMDSMDVIVGSILGPEFKVSNAYLNGIADTNGYDSLLACFVVKYHGVYGNCGGRPTTVIPVTTITTTVQQFTDGTSRSFESDRETNNHTVLRDHSTAWREYEGRYSDPQLMRYAAMLSKSMSPEGKDLNLGYKLADAIEGLIKAMRTYPCDHDVTQRMEANLLDLFNGRSPRRTGPVGTNWKH